MCGDACECGGTCEPTVQHESGMIRSDPAGKLDYTLVDLHMLERWARLLTVNVPSKGRGNWRNASTEEDELRAKQSAWRHFLAWQRGETDEDHAAALVFNVSVVERARRRGAA